MKTKIISLVDPYDYPDRYWVKERSKLIRLNRWEWEAKFGVQYTPVSILTSKQMEENLRMAIHMWGLNETYNGIDAYYRDQVKDGLLGPVYIGKTRHMGYGLFSREDMMAGTLLGEYAGQIIDRREVQTINPYLFDLHNWWHPCPGDELCMINRYIVDARHMGNEMRFANHSDKPNVESRHFIDDMTVRIILFTKTSVSKGDELLYHYGEDFKNGFDSRGRLRE